MRGHEAVAATALRSGELIGAETNTGHDRHEQSSLLRWHRNRSAVIYDAESMSAVVYLTSCPLKLHDRKSVFHSFVNVQSGR